MQEEKKRAALEYLPAFITLLAGIVTLILYAVLIRPQKGTVYAAVPLIALVPFPLIWVNRRCKLGLPMYLVVLICLHFVLAVDVGTAMGVYKLLSWWDLFVHGYFGFLCCGVLYYLYLRFEKRPPKAVHLIVMVLLVIAFATLWEIYEYVADLFLHSDMQGIESALEAGIPPLTDTMTDILIAIAGAVLFCIVPIVAHARRRHAPSGERDA